MTETTYTLNSKLTRGFTIIELIVVISVVSVLSALGIAGYSKYNDAQIVQSGAQDVATTLNLAKSRALYQVKPSNSGNCLFPNNPIDRYIVEVDLTGSANTYKLLIQCGGGAANDVFQKTLPKNVTFNSAGTTLTSYSFPVLTGGVAASGQIKIELAGGTSKTITVDSVGNIKIQ